MSQISNTRCPSFARSAEQFIQTSEGKLAMQKGAEAVAAELTSKEGPNGYSPEISTWEAQPAAKNGAIAITEQNASMNGNVDKIFVGVQGNKVVAAGTDVLHYNQDAWQKEVTIEGPVTKESLQASIGEAVLDPSGRQPDEKPFLTEREIVGEDWLANAGS